LQQLKSWFLAHPRSATNYAVLSAVILIVVSIAVLTTKRALLHPIKSSSVAVKAISQTEAINQTTVPNQANQNNQDNLPTQQTANNAATASAINKIDNTNTANLPTNITEKVVTIGKADSLQIVFKRLHLSQNDAKKILALTNAKDLRNMSVGQKIAISLSDSKMLPMSKPDKSKKKQSQQSLLSTKQLEKIVYAINLTDTLVVSKDSHNNNLFQAKVHHIEPIRRLEYVALTANKSSSIHTAAKESGISRKLVAQLINIFQDKINLEKSFRTGDTVALLYENQYLNNKKINSGTVVAVEYTHAGKIDRALAFTDQHGRTSYYTPDGYALQSPFIRYPLKFKCISSPFSLHRIHPVYKTISAHTGVDLSASYGQPIKATSDGVISFIGSNGSYGRTIEIKYNEKYSTLYAHLSGFAKNLKNGDRVKQGQLIGYVGNSGMATGTHLHYEFHVNNVPHDPVKVKFPNGGMIAKAHRAQFLAQQKQWLAKLNFYKHRVVANKTVPATRQIMATTAVSAATPKV